MQKNIRKESSQPSFGGGILVDRSELTKTRRLNTYGVITIFWSWAYPCSRSWYTILPILDMPLGATRIRLFVKSIQENKSVLIDDFTVTTNSENSALALNRHNQFEFKSGGRYHLVAEFPDYNTKTNLHFDVLDREWPKFTESELSFVKTLPKKSIHIRVTIECPKCNSPYIFEESVPEKEPQSKGVHHFPKRGIFRCKKRDCNESIMVKDIQGQVRTSLKENIDQLMQER